MKHDFGAARSGREVFFLAALGLALAAGTTLPAAAQDEIGPQVTREQAIADIKYNLEHPRVYHSLEEVERARRNAETTKWGRAVRDQLVSSAEQHVLFRLSEEEVRALAPVTAPDGKTYFAYRSHKFGSVNTGRVCPIDGSALDMAGLDQPGKTTCEEGHIFPNEQFPDRGDGVLIADPPADWAAAALDRPQRFWLVAVFNGDIAKLMEKAVEPLAYAYAVSGDKRFARRAAVLLDILAQGHHTSSEFIVDRGDSAGKLWRPGYQVGRALRAYTNGMDLIWNSGVLDEPSAANPGMTMKQHIAENMMVDGADFIWQDMGRYKRSFHNGTRAYIEGIFTVSSLLGLEVGYVDWSLDGSVSLDKFLANSVFRDGQYYEHGYDDTYIGWAELAHHLRNSNYPNGVQIYDDPRMINLNVTGPLRFGLVGRRPQFGDVGWPDMRVIRSPYYGDFSRVLPFYARTADPLRRAGYAQLLAQIAQGDPNEAMEADTWALFNIDGAIDGFDLEKVDRHVRPSELLEGKGHVMLRPAQGHDRGAFLHYGPTLSHGHTDEMALMFYAGGRDMSYDPGHNPLIHTRFGFLRQTVAHNVVVVNETSQVPAHDPGGSVIFFADRDGYAVTELEAPYAYDHEGVNLYRRVTAYVDASPEQSYLVDIFRVDGHRVADYSFHGRGVDFKTDLTLSAPEAGSLASPEYSWADKAGPTGEIIGFENEDIGFNAPPGTGYGFLGQPRRAAGDRLWRAEWLDAGPRGDDPARVRITMLPETGREIIVADAPDPLVRNLKLDPAKHKLPYLLARDAGDGPAQFVAVIEPVGDQPYPVGAVEPLRVEDSRPAGPFTPVALKVELAQEGVVDYFLSSFDGQSFSAGDADVTLTTDAGFAMVRVDGDGVREARMEKGTTLDVTHGGRTMTIHAPEREWGGRIVEVQGEGTAIRVDIPLPKGRALQGRHVLVDAPEYTHNSPMAIDRIEPAGTGSLIRLKPTNLVMGLGEVERIGDDTVTSVARFPMLRTRNYYVPTGQDPSGNTYYNGRRVVNTRSGAETIIHGANSSQELVVQDPSIFTRGDDIAVIEIKAGDLFTIPLTAEVNRVGERYALDAPEGIELTVTDR